MNSHPAPLSFVIRVCGFPRRAAFPGAIGLLLILCLGLTGRAAAEPADPMVLIHCVKRGIYKITGQELATAGVDLRAIDTGRMALVHYDQSVPIYCVGMDNRRFDPHGAFYFFAEGAPEHDHPFINMEGEHVGSHQYFMLHLVASSFEPLRFSPSVQDTPGELDVRNYFSRTVTGRLTVESDPIFHLFEHANVSSQRTDYLYQAQLTYPDSDRTSSSYVYEFALPHADPRKGGQLTVSLYAAQFLADGGNKPLHHVAVELNGQPLDEIRWADNRVDAILKIPPRLCRKDYNKVVFTVREPTIEKESARPRTPAGTTGKGPTAKGPAATSTAQASAPGSPSDASSTPPRVDTVMFDWFSLELKQSTEVFDNYNELRVEDPEDQHNVARFSVRGFEDPNVLVFDLAAREVLLAKSFKQSPDSLFYAVNLARPARATNLVALGEKQAMKPQALIPVVDRKVFEQPVDCDFLILTHPAFKEALQPLVAWKQAHGFNVHVTDIMDLFNERTGGYPGPEPIRDYIKTLATTQKDKKLRYVLLVGDSSSIAKYQTFLPAYSYLQSGGHVNDNYFATLSSPDAPPQLAVGRLSVREPQEVVNYVRKEIAYESGQSMGNWRARVLAISATSSWARQDAEAILDQHAQPKYITAMMRSSRPDPTPGVQEQITRELVDRFNQGNLLTVFFGHGGGAVWEVGPSVSGEGFRRHLFDQDNVKSLTNTDRPAVVLALTCYTNDFDTIGLAQTLGETFINSPGGAVGVIGAACRSATETNFMFTESFFTLWEVNGQARLGDLFADAKKQVHGGDANSTYILLGDPTLEMKLPQNDLTVNALAWGSGARLRFDYALPATFAVPAKLDCTVINHANQTVAEWTIEPAAGKGTVTHALDKLDNYQQLRLVVCGAEGNKCVHVGHGVVPAYWPKTPPVKPINANKVARGTGGGAPVQAHAAKL